MHIQVETPLGSNSGISQYGCKVGEYPPVDIGIKFMNYYISQENMVV